MDRNPKIGRALNRTFWAAYDHFGLICLFSVLWALFSCTLVLAPSATFSAAHLSNLMARGKTPAFKDFFIQLKAYFLKSTQYFLFFLLITGLLIFNELFYITRLTPLRLILAGLNFWIIIFFLLINIYALPLFTAGRSFKEVLKLMFVLSLQNPGFSAKVLICGSLLLLMAPFLPICGIGVFCVFLQQAFWELQARYDETIELPVERRTFKGNPPPVGNKQFPTLTTALS